LRRVKAIRAEVFQLRVAEHRGRISKTMQEARTAVEAARRELPTLTPSSLAKALPTRPPDGLKPYLDAQRAAGLPE
jgi:hypothetical protein